MYLSGVRCFLFFGYGAAPFFPLLSFLKCRIICNPDGIEWRRPISKIKQSYFKLCEKLISKSSIIKIFDSYVIQRYYSINHRASGKTLYYPSIFEKKNIYPKKTKKFVRFYIIGRLLEENNTKQIVNVFTKLSKDKKLYIIGPKNLFYINKILPLIKNSKNIIYLGGIYDEEKLFNLCILFDYYIHGHSVGGTNPTLIEAVSLQKSIIAFKTTFNKEILGHNAVYFNDENDLFKILKYTEYDKFHKPIFKKEYTADFINKSYLEVILSN